MKRFYVFLFFLFVSVGLFAQIGPSWWQMLPEDYKTNPFVRDTLTIIKVADDVVENAATLTELWDGVLSEKTDLATVSNGACNITNAADMSAQGMAFFDNTNFYVLFNVNDEDTTASDRIEQHLAPYANKYDPGRPIYLDRKSTMFKDSSDGSGYYMFGERHISEADYTDMALYGSWTEAGAYKTEWLLVSGDNLFPGSPTYTLKGDDKDTLNDVQMGAVDVACSSILELKPGGYLFMNITPLSIWENAPDPVNFPMMSIALKVDDADADNIDCTTDDTETDVDRSEAWGPGATGNDAYWAIGYFGGVGKFDFITGIQKLHPDAQSKVYYHSDYLRFTRNEVISKVDIYNIAGQLVKSVNSPSEMISLTNLQKGVYIIRTTELSNVVSIVKIVR